MNREEQLSRDLTAAYAELRQLRPALKKAEEAARQAREDSAAQREMWRVVEGEKRALRERLEAQDRLIEQLAEACSVYAPMNHGHVRWGNDCAICSALAALSTWKDRQ